MKLHSCARRSVVVALRGTTSVEDIITDSVAEPQRLDPEWVPKCIRSLAKGPLYAHAGIKAAADAILKVCVSSARSRDHHLRHQGQLLVPK